MYQTSEREMKARNPLLPRPLFDGSRCSRAVSLEVRCEAGAGKIAWDLQGVRSVSCTETAARLPCGGAASAGGARGAA
jgi:hypothetical protein